MILVGVRVRLLLWAAWRDKAINTSAMRISSQSVVSVFIKHIKI